MRTAKVILFMICLLPLLRAIWIVATGEAVNPIEFALRSSGTWALVALLLSLAVTPLRQLTGLNALIRFRRMLGLFAFFYALLHFSIWLGLDRYFEWASIIKDLTRRPFIIAGFTAFLILLALAITSTDGWVRRLKRRWGLLHRLVYLAAPLAVLHYFWLVKLDLRQPMLFASVLAVLLGWRVAYRYKNAFRKFFGLSEK